MNLTWKDCTPEIAKDLDAWLTSDDEAVRNIKKFAMFDGTFSEELEYYRSGQSQYEGRIADYVKVVYVDVASMADGEDKLLADGEDIPVTAETIPMAYVKIGYYTYDDIYEIGINPIVINPQFQGKGYGKAVVRDLVTNCAEIIGGKVDSIDAGIDVENVASRKVFESLGFEVYGGADDGLFLYYRKRVGILPIEF